ncbi:MAG: serine hydroxymethyltransferase [Ignavibacteria bacterium]|nr:serine hydroxymethyltransferase [Ignavibacteria bacterium]
MSRIEEILEKEKKRQSTTISFSAAENIVSKRVMDILSHPIMNKTAEGYPGKRYHGGTEYLDEIEIYAQELVKKLFGAKYANVQPHCAANANYAVLFSVLKKDDIILSMKLDHGGHITHGSGISITGEIFKTINYNVKSEDFLIDYDQIRDLAKKHKPKLIIAGSSAYPRVIDFNIIRQISDETNSYFLADVSHFAGLIAGGEYPNPVNTADFTTFSTYKTLRGPRGGIVIMGEKFCDKSDKYPKLTLSKAIDFTLFPGVQSAILPNYLAAKAAAFEEALKPQFRKYAKDVIINARALVGGFAENGIFVLTGGTDTHQVIIDVSKLGLTGLEAQKALEECGIIQNRNMLPYDTKPPFITSGVRFGTSASTTIGLNAENHKCIAEIINEVLKSVKRTVDTKYYLDEQVIKKNRDKIIKLIKKIN